jgi:predicted ATP-grasp superfamily ATP-dependent carboligase
MNMFYTGLGIARSLGERGVKVIGLTSQRRVYGNFTRRANVVWAPDSRREPEALLKYLVGLGEKLGNRSVLFPTRDDDLVFIDRFRKQLEPYFSPVAPAGEALRVCLDKGATFTAAQGAGVAAPRTWTIEGPADLERASREATFPCVLKPLSAHHWRQGANWDLVGARKAIGIASETELRAEYRAVAHADRRALVQEMIPGPDDRLLIVACYVDRESRWIAGFNTRKVLQIPQGFGTGCIVESVACPELFERTVRLLQAIRFTGIAEVEYKWDEASDEYKLIEVNPRPWDQHRLGKAAGVDLMYLAYCEHAGLRMPVVPKPTPGHKWIAEEAFATAMLRALWSGKPKPRTLLQRARGNRIYAIWSAGDPLPGVAFWIMTFFPELFGAVFRALAAAVKKMLSRKVNLSKKEMVYETHVEKP